MGHTQLLLPSIPVCSRYGWLAVSVITAQRIILCNALHTHNAHGFIGVGAYTEESFELLLVSVSSLLPLPDVLYW